MALIEKGRVCVIVKGADAGKTVVIKEVTDANFVIVTGQHTKERKINVKHLEPTVQTGEVPTGKKVDVKEKKAQAKPAVKAAAPVKAAKKPAKKA